MVPWHQFSTNYDWSVEGRKNFRKPNATNSTATSGGITSMEDKGSLAEAPEASILSMPEGTLSSQQDDAKRSLQITKKNKCPRPQQPSLSNWLNGEHGPTSTIAVPRVDCEQENCSRDRQSSISTVASDVSGTERRSSSPDSQDAGSGVESTPSLPATPPLGPTASPNIPPSPSLPPLSSKQSVVHAEAVSQMRCAHAEAVLSAVVLAPAEGANEWLAKCTPSKNELAVVSRCIEELNALARKGNPNWSVLPFGSHVSGLALQGSDLDATCFMSESIAEDPGGQSALDALKWVLRPLLKDHPSFKITEQIFNARVPIMKLRFENSLDVDLSCHNTRPLQNSSLIHAYVQVHPVVRELILAVKMWAKAADVCGASEGKLSCYTFALMVIYCMQVDPSVALPYLPVATFDLVSPKPPGKLQPVWACALPLHVLLARFFMFYSEVFSWGSEVVSVRLGRRAHASNRQFELLPYRTSRRIHIEDPYDLKRNLHCVLGINEEGFLKAALGQASEVVRTVSLERPMCLPKGGSDSGTAKAKEEITSSKQTIAPDIIAEAKESEPIKESAAVVTQETKRHEVVKLKPKAVEDAPQDDMKWWFSFIGSSCAYTLYAMYNGQLFRLTLAFSALILILISIEQRRRGGVSAFDCWLPDSKVDNADNDGSVRQHRTRRGRHRDKYHDKHDKHEKHDKRDTQDKKGQPLRDPPERE